MAFKDRLKNAFIPVAMALTSMVASPAYALEMNADGCLAPAALMAQLKAEGQGSVVFANRVIPATAKSPATAAFTIFTANKAGKGYSFEGDQPSGTPSTKFCMSGDFNNARGLDSSVASIPVGISANSNLAKAVNYSIKEKGFNPMFYGEKDGAIIVVVGNPNKKSELNGMILVGNNDPTRKAGDHGGLTGLDYSPNFDRSFAMAGDMRVAAAAFTPKP